MNSASKEQTHALPEKVLRALCSAVDVELPVGLKDENWIRARNQLILVLLLSGLRSGEALQMRSRDLNRIFWELQEKVPDISVRLTTNEFRRAVIAAHLAGLPRHAHKIVSHGAKGKNFSSKIKNQSKKEK